MLSVSILHIFHAVLDQDKKHFLEGSESARLLKPLYGSSSSKFTASFDGMVMVKTKSDPVFERLGPVGMWNAKMQFEGKR